MSEWKNRTTLLVRDDVKVYIMSYMPPFGKEWWSCCCVYGHDEPSMLIREADWKDAEERHDEFVRIVEAMGYTVISETIDGKEKAPEAAATAQGAEK